MPQLLWLLIAFLVGVLAEWLLEIFYFRRRVIEQLEADHSRHEQVLKEWQARGMTLEAGLAERDTELESARAAGATLQADLETCSMARASLLEENTSLKAQADQLQTDLSAAAARASALAAEVKSRDAALARLSAELDAQVSQNSSLTADLAQFTTAAATATATIKTLGNEKAGLSAQAADLESRLVKAQADASAALQSSTQWEADVKARDAESVKLRAALDTQLGQNQDMTANVARLRQEAAAATAAIKESEQAKSELELQVGQLKADLNACMSARASLEAERAQHVESDKLQAQGVRGQGIQVAADAASASAPAREVPEVHSDLLQVSEVTEAPPAIVAVPEAIKVTEPTAAVAFSPEQVFLLRNRSADDETPFETACPQHLSDVKGIGTVFEARLYEAGIGTYWELSKLSDDQLKNILRMSELQSSRADYAATRADARRLAQETRSLGRKWMRCPPDDFEPMGGIGHTFEKRLYDAGICTYEALANSTVELLEQVCQAPARFKPDYASWIEQAKVLSAEKAKRQNRA